MTSLSDMTTLYVKSVVKFLIAKLEKETGIKFDSYDLKLLYICDECKQKDTTDIKRC